MKPDVLRFLFTNTQTTLYRESCVGTKKGFLIRDVMRKRIEKDS